MLSLLALSVQLQVGSAVLLPTEPPPAPVRVAVTAEDSLRDVERAHDAQAGFERGRRYVLPWGAGSGGHCDVHVGRFCWWYEEGATIPSEPEEVTRRRAELLAELDDLGARLPQDPWIAGMRVYYRVDNRQAALAADAAAQCATAGWWCTALRAWAAQAAGDAAAADSGFSAALAAMPDSTRCAWTNIAPLLPGGVRDRYEKLGCAERAGLDSRYWTLSIPRLSAGVNEWHAEYLARRVAATLLASAVSPHRLPWGDDSAELLLRYGWPIAWSRIPPTGMSVLEPDIMGHDPAPSFAFGVREAVLDSTASAGDDGWDLADLHAESRYARPGIRRIAAMSAQLARFRRADSTIVVARWSTIDDSLSHPRAAMGAATRMGVLARAAADSSSSGTVQLRVAGIPVMAGVELSDSASGTFARSRRAWAAADDPRAGRISDLLLFRPTDDRSLTLDEALALAIPGDTASLSRPLGLYWESYGAEQPDSAQETSVLVERIDTGFLRSFRQRVGLAEPDSPLRVRWSEPQPPRDGLAPRTLTLDLAQLPAGRYRISVSVTPPGGTPAVTSAEVQLRE